MLAEGKTSPIDCGVVLLADDDATWQAATECASTAAAAQEGFKVAFQQPSDDSFVFEGFYGVVGFVYGTGRLYTDTFGDPMLGAYTCTSVALNDICDVGNSAHCLECLGPGEVTPLDCAM